MSDMERGNFNCAQRYGYPYTEKMHFSLCMLFLLMLNQSLPLCYARDENSGRIKRAEGHSEQHIKQIFYTHSNCIRSDWACNEACRLEYVNRTTGLCISPSPTETCFGIPIRYNYTFENANIVASLTKYEILSKFPRCWSVLGPLLCAVAYRPCSNRAYFEVSMNEPGKMELWQVFRKEMCQQAVEKCGFLVENGVWPSFINCSDTVKSKGGRRIFSDGSCAMAYDQEPSKMEPKQCLWPLTVGISHSKPIVRPIIDDCYLPCRSPLISSQWLYDSFRTLIFTFSLLIVVGSLICTLYLLIFSLLFTNDLCVYSLTHALLNASIHWSIWLLSYSDRVAERAMCFDMLRRDAKVLRILLDWCSIQFWLLYTTIFSGFFWLLIALAIQIGRPDLNSQNFKWNKHESVDLRSFFLNFYLVAGTLAAIALWADTVETDGISGVCYFGFHKVSSAANLYGPVLVIFILFLLAIVCFRKFKRGGTANRSEKREQIALVIDHVDDDKGSFGCEIATKNGYSQMGFFWQNLFCITTSLSFIAIAVLLHSTFFTDAVLEKRIILDSVRCSLNKTIMKDETMWLRGILRDRKSDAFSRLASIGNGFLSAPGCELSLYKDDQLLPIFLVYLFFPSFPFIAIITYVLTGFFGFGMNGIERVRSKFNPFVLVKCSESTSKTRKHQSDDALVTGAFSSSYKLEQSNETSLKKCENIQHSENNDDESRDMFPTDLKIRKLDVLERTKERRRRQMENGYLFWKPTDSTHLTSSFLSTYQSGFIDGHWRERCVNYEKQIKALSANLRVADHEIRRLAGLESSKKPEFPHVTGSVDPISADQTSLISAKYRLQSTPRDGRNVFIDSGNRTSNKWTQNVNLSGKLAGSQGIKMQNNFRISDENEKMMSEVSFLKAQTFMQDPLSENADADQLSGSFRGSDSFNSDEEDSEEERLCNEKVQELQRTKQ